MKGIIKGITQEEHIQKLQEKIKNLQEELKKTKEEINKILDDNLKTTKNESKEKLILQEKLKKTKNELEEKNKILADNLNLIKNESKEKIILQENLKKTKNELEIYKLNDYNEKYIGQKLEKFYDVVINIRSIRDLNIKEEGWPIKWNTNIKSTKEFLNSNKKLLKIGILGNGNIGKSFLLSRLFDEDIPSGFSVITEGLSLKINQENSYALLDSAGLQTPLLINEYNNENKNLTSEEKFEEYANLYRDKTQTENFIQHLILSLSEMLIIVVGKITFNEQRLINKIKGVLSNQKSKKPIFIIHNLFNFQTKEQVEEYIYDILMKSASFKLEKVEEPYKKDNQGLKRFSFIEKEEDSTYYTYHLLMAREHTIAGDYFNQYTYEFLRERFNDFPERGSLSILDEIKKKFVEWSGVLLEEKIKDENIIIKKENDIETKFIYEDILAENNDKNIEKKDKIIPKACLSNELGVLFYRSSGYEPSYNCYVENNLLVVKLEVPGNVNIDEVYASSKENAIVIEGCKNEDNEKDNEEETIKDENKNKDKLKNFYKSTRKFGKFKLIITYSNEIKIASEESIEDEEEKNTEPINGILTRRFRLIKRRKKNNIKIE